ncbi:MAG: hypothetical protein DSY80_03010 [Desulfocapsa sp.]|nr:MAG: hypothetical protein DSY80_03010 [Desulfocapsa sp.]
MDFSHYELVILVCGIVFFGITLQAMIGFGYALIATPLLLSTGLPLVDIVVITTVTSTSQRLIFGYQMREHAQVKLYMPIVMTSIIGIPLGIYILTIVSGERRDIIKQVIGALILLTVIVQVTVKIQPRERIANSWGYLLGGIAGVLSGFANIGGPAHVLWTYAHQWTKEQLRATPLLLSIPMIPIQLGLLFYSFDVPIKVFIFGFLLSPVALAANQLGQIAGKRFNMKVLRSTVVLSLGLIGLYYVIEPYL